MQRDIRGLARAPGSRPNSSTAGPLAVVTGAGGAIGAAIARRLRAEGCRVLAVDLDQRGLSVLSSESADYAIHVADLGTAAGREAILALASRLGGAQYLVNGAAILRAKPLAEVRPDDFHETYRVNVEAAFFLARDLATAMTPGGAVVNVGSSAAKTGTTVELAAYSASKAALSSVTRTLAFAFASAGIRINCVAPGAVDTRLQADLVASIAASRHVDAAVIARDRISAVPLGRLAMPDEVASVTWFLLSPDASFMTGQSINVTGGLVTW